jgi:DnaJ like chaperone protein
MLIKNKKKNLAKRLYNEGKQPNFNFEMALYELKKTCRDNRELLKLFADMQYRAAQVDGLTANKIKLLDIAFTILGFAPLNQQSRFYYDFGYNSSTQDRNQQNQKDQNYRQSSSSQNYYKKQTPPDNLSHAFALLEISSSANKHEVKRAYRRLLSRNHPDKLIAKGLPEEMIKIANDKTQKIMKAYELICQSKGW